MQKPKVLVVDDDPGIRKFVRANLDARNYEVMLAENGVVGLQIFEKGSIDLVILDIMMPFLDGYEVCRRIREHSTVPIIILSAKDEENDKLRCLELGADDYITKPFSLNELLCRVKVIFRRTLGLGNPGNQAKINYGEMEIDCDLQKVFLRGHEVNLSDTEYKILIFLAINAGKIITPDNILERVWGCQSIEKRHLLWVNICRLRNKLDNIYAGNCYIQTRPGIGYSLSLTPL
jgi:two-component system, OmpR family, KDP operon response regulator KdpE